MRSGGGRRQRRRSVLVFGINYAPEPTGIALNTTWLTENLSERGWDVTMVTGMPHYPAWRREAAPRRSANGRVSLQRHVHYVPARQSAMRRATYELSWTTTALVSLLPSRRPAVVLGVVPSLGGGVLARLGAVRYRVPYALLFQDLLGRAAEQSGVPGADRVAGLVQSIEVRLARGAERIGVVADGFRDYFVRAGVPASRIQRVRNPARLGTPTQPREAVRTRLGWRRDEFVVVHTGSMGYKQGLESVIDAADLARDDGKLRFVFQGDGNQKHMLQSMAQERRLGNVDFLPLAAADEFPNILCAADALLLNQRQSIRNMSMPAKLASYFLAGIPTVAAVAPSDEVAREIESARGGVIVEPGDPTRLLEQVVELRADRERARELGLSARAFAERELSEEATIEGFDAMLRACMSARIDEKGHRNARQR
jgi:putative colanic acid biosynthesis glycosyltransferase WcaI